MECCPLLHRARMPALPLGRRCQERCQDPPQPEFRNWLEPEHRSWSTEKGGRDSALRCPRPRPAGGMNGVRTDTCHRVVPRLNGAETAQRTVPTNFGVPVERSCDTSSQKSAGDAFVASYGSEDANAGEKATEASLSPCGDEASPPFSAGRCGVWPQILQRFKFPAPWSGSNRAMNGRR